MSSGLRSIEDVSARLKVPGTGMDTRLLWLCGHKQRNGKRRGKLLLLCADCVAKEKANA